MSPKAPKPVLYNKYDRETLMKRLADEPFARRTLSFYRYVVLPDPQSVRDQLFLQWDALGCFGRIYLAEEGINAQMSVPEHHWDQFVAELYTWEAFRQVPFKLAVEDDGKSFFKLTVKVRVQIVADGLTLDDYDVTNVGHHLNAQEWNTLMDSGEAIVVDMRNYYESEIGHFDGALLPQAETFREELPEVLHMLIGQEEKPVLLYCTGGIRCEKTSAYLKHHGFQNVNQLHGGIIDYARQIEEAQLPNKFRGKNFVFDARLGEHISSDVIAHCHQCSAPADAHVNCANKACNLLFIQCDACQTTHEHTCSPECQAIIHLPEEEQANIRRERAAQTRAKRYHRAKP
ncbi:MAG TPA: hypothetical protein DCE13_00565 [Cryomorphaceae bacterium]|jgi:UPF0176 protein|nr:MAG: sulfurtransferase [Cryomorphaceae bacterium BACL7 MAG-120910-bin2]KRO69250.1 MAG: sulfurtransferase [Cryomorphaceae bacterium BACL7 MAG-120322-bin74]KRO82221.1 MAG: sulfurtransferase [Cryomorphaceae bacterium BACL7 MAG-121220-bin83]HAB31015.1 hypothetical protein [Cryomorphaceae bacterium]